MPDAPRPAAVPPGCDRLLRVAARLAPADVRALVLREWRAEVAWRATRARRGSADAAWRLRVRCLGAVSHALWLRWDRWRLEMLWDDFRQALRTLGRKPGFAAIVILTLAVGIGANAAIFSAVRAVVLKPLPYPAADELVRVFKFYIDRSPGFGGTTSPPDFVDWRAAGEDAFVEMAAVVASSYSVTGDGLPAEQAPGAAVTGGFFRVLGIAPLHGRLLELADEAAGGPSVAVIGHELWQRRFGGDPATVGRTLEFDGEPTRIVGILPAGIGYPLGSEIWMPLRFTPRDLETQRGAHYLDVVARLKHDRTIEAARAQMSTVGGRLAADYPRTNRDTTVTVYPMHQVLVGDVRPAMLMLLGAVGLVLLIVCVNVASLVLTRALGRSRELAVRAALGAGRFRLVRGLLVESLVLAGVGGAAGLALAAWAAAAIAALPERLGIPRLDQTAVDGQVLAFTAGVSLLTALLFGTLPAWQASRVRDVAERMRADGPTTTGERGRQRMRGALIVVEVALAGVLLVGAGLLLQSFARLTSVDLGFDPRSVQTFNISMPEAKYDTPEKRAAYVAEVVSRVRAVPGVSSAGAIFGLPLSDFRYGISGHTKDGRVMSDEEQDAHLVQVRVVTPGYFESLGIPVVRGRGITGADARGAAPVILFNEAAAKHWFPGEDALGRHATIGTRLGQGGERAGGTIVGVVGDVRDFGGASVVRPTIYLSHAQFPMGFVTVAARTAVPTGGVLEPMRATLIDLDPEVPMYRVRTMEQLSADAVAQPRLYMLLLGLFAGAALLLAAIGIYGVLSHAVSQRTREIGIRLALGARRAEVVGLVVRHAGIVAVVGILLGLGAAAGLSGLIQGLLFGVTPTDGSTYAAVGAGVLAVALAAAWIPAYRAARIDPVRALRTE